MLKSNHIVGAILITSFLVLGVTSSIALAVDAKTTPGVACQERYGSQAADFNRYSPYIQNTSTSTRYVVCPVVRDNTDNTNGTDSYYTDVRVYNAGGTLWCYLDSSDETGALRNWDYRSTTTTGYVALENDLNTSYVRGYYNLYCSLPPNSRIQGYRIGEY